MLAAQARRRGMAAPPSMAEEAIFFNVGNNCGVAHALLGAWIIQGRGTIIRFREIHDELVTEMPTVQSELM